MKTIFKNLMTCLTLLSQILPFALPATAQTSPTLAHDVASGHNNFAIDLYQALGQKDGNLFFSPLSISTALSMTYAGAKNQTATDMQKVMHFPASDSALHQGNMVLQMLLENKLSENGQLTLANALWPDLNEPLLESFVANLKQYYGAAYQTLDFSSDPGLALNTINQWVEEKTHGRIVDLLGPGDITERTSLVLTNAIVFDGLWKQAFDPAKTVPLDFHLPDGGSIKVQAMVQTSEFMHADLGEFRVLEMPFKGTETSFLIVLPDDVDGLADLEKELSPSAINQWRAQMRETELKLVLPRFEMTERVELSEVLTELGMGIAFSGDTDFTGISAQKGLAISKVIHQATFRINEEGAEAAAATAVIMLRSSILTAPFEVDHPFLFMIRHQETGSIIFMGRMMNPDAQ